MRKITKDAINAFMNGKTFSRDNTAVTTDDYTTRLFLHGNEIATKFHPDGSIQIRSAGWKTATTKERLNGIPGVSINQRKGVWYLNDEKWDGSWTTLWEAK